MTTQAGNGAPVAISGAGPVGLAVALGLARAGVRSVVLDKKALLDPHSRATLILPRTLEIFGQWAVLHQLLAADNPVPHVRLREPGNDHQILHINFTKLADQTAAMFALAIPQDRTTQILLNAVQATGLVEVRFATELLGFEQDTTGVRLRIRTAGTASTQTASYLVGADGAHSTVRDQLGVELVGKTYPTQALLADVRIDPGLDRTDTWPTILGHRGIVVGIRFGNRIWRIIEQVVDERLTGPARPCTITSSRWHRNCARPHRRVALVRALDALFGFGHSAGALTYRFSMLDVPYKQSSLLHGHSTRLGQRVPDVLTADGERIYPKMAAGAVLCAGDPTHSQALAAQLGLPLVNGDVAALTRFFDRDHYVALIRPDHIVGAIADPAIPDHPAFSTALGRQLPPERQPARHRRQ